MTSSRWKSPAKAGRIVKQGSLELLNQVPIFAVLDAAEREALATLTQEKSVDQEEYIFWEGDPSDWFYIVNRGKVKIFKSASSGKEVTLSFFGPGEVFGEVAVLENRTYPASAQAVSPVQLIGIKKADFWDLLLKHPSIGIKLISLLSGRLREAQSRLRDMAGERVEQRLARLLIHLSEKLGATLPFTRQELSDMAGTTTETTIRILSQWKDQAVINSVRGKILIADEKKLRQLGEGPEAA
jgi:CRP/FNR family transcriptional regulator, nitrogen oxide reductase regulator